MAFRRTAEKRTNDAPRVVGRWLREVLFEDWGLKLFALAITLGLWFGVTSQRAPATIRLSGQLSFLRPEDVEISKESLKQVDVTLRGNKDDLDNLSGRNLVLTVDISRYTLGERVVRLTPETVSMSLPDGVRIEKIEPGSVPLRLERRIEREVQVEPRLEGDLPEGYEVRGVQVTPRRVKVRGPESHVKALERAPTETISLEGQRESLPLQQISIDILDPKVVALDPVVAVRVEVGEVRIERRLSGVGVRTSDAQAKARPAKVNVLVRGDRSVVENLSAEDFEIILESAPDGSLRPRLRLPSGINGRVELLSTSPAEFSIER
ncbi:MAG TPA: CdaR family protein [Pyrinomonadaceae bacterium]|jgi:YbbR domain-containing protein|nr:CdaR family protein [Pyrinomonadaceae bacterium]